MKTIGGNAWREHARRNVGLFRRALGRDPNDVVAHEVYSGAHVRYMTPADRKSAEVFRSIR